MLDLNNITLSSLLSLPIKECPDDESLPPMDVKEQQDDEGTIDPGAFVFLLSQMTPPELEQPEPKATNLLETQSLIENKETEGVSAEPAPLDDNVAMTWINSDYYQSEMQTDKHVALMSQEQDGEIINRVLSDNPVEILPLDAAVLDTEVVTQSPTAFAGQSEFASESKRNLNPTLQNMELVPPLSSDDKNLPPQNSQVVFDNLAQLVMNAENAVQKQEVEPEQNEISLVPPSTTSFVEILKQDNNKVSLSSVTTKIDVSAKSLGPDEENYFEEESLPLEIDSLIKPKMNFFETEMKPALNVTPTNPDSRVFNNPLSHNISHSFAASTKAEGFTLNALPTELAIANELHDPQWSKQFSDHVIWMGQQGGKSAVIKLHPEDLGPLEINVKVINDSASVTIASHSAQVREMLDQTLPKLQEMMAEHGLNLSEMNIDSDSGERQFAHRNQQAGDEFSTSHHEEEAITQPIIKKSTLQGVIDYFA